MLYLAADGLKEHKLYITSPKLDIAEYTEEKSGFDRYLKVTGSGFLIHNNKGIAYRMRDMSVSYTHLNQALQVRLKSYIPFLPRAYRRGRKVRYMNIQRL